MPSHHGGDCFYPAATIEDWRTFQRDLAEDAMAPLSRAERRELMSLLKRVKIDERAS